MYDRNSQEYHEKQTLMFKEHKKGKSKTEVQDKCKVQRQFEA